MFVLAYRLFLNLYKDKEWKKLSLTGLEYSGDSVVSGSVIILIIRQYM